MQTQQSSIRKYPHELFSEGNFNELGDIYYGLYDRLLDWGHGVINIVVAPAMGDGLPDWDRAEPANLEQPSSDSGPADMAEVRRWAILVDNIEACDPATSILLWIDPNDSGCMMQQVAGPEADSDIAKRIIGRSIDASPPAGEYKPPKLTGSLQGAAPKPANDNHGIRLLSFSEFKAQENSTADALIKGLVRTGTLIAIGGRPGAGKTALTLAMADALDAGKPFIGRETKPTTIVVIAAEDGGDVANRLEAMGNDRIKIAKLPEGLPLTKPQKAAAVAREVVRQAKALDPDRHVMIVVDTLRAALGGVSVLEDKTTSPALNALREVAESEGAVVAILNHTNRENNKATKGETLEAVAALELVLLEGEGEWFTIYVGKNRSGPGHRNIGKVRYTSANVGDVTAAVVDEIVADETISDEPKERGPSDNAKILQGIIQTAILEARAYHQPFGAEGPRVKFVYVDDVRAAFYARKDGTADTKKKAFGRALDHWLRNEWIVRGEDRDSKGLLWFARAADEVSGQGDGTPPYQASVPSVPQAEGDGTGQVDRNCPVCPSFDMQEAA